MRSASAISLSALGRGSSIVGIAGVVLVLLAGLPAPPAWSLLAFCLGGMALVWSVASTIAADVFVTRVATVSVLVRSALAGALYVISAEGWPIARHLQIGRGFWVFSPDSTYFHDYARGAAIALKIGIGMPFVAGAPDYPLVLAALYAVFGPHPLYPIFVNVWTVSLTVVLAAVLSRELWGRSGSRFTALVVAGWPSLIVWSAMLLRDALVLFLIVAFFFAFRRFETAPSRLRWGALLAVLFFFVNRGRFYVGAALLFMVVAVTAVEIVDALRRRRAGLAGAGLVAALVVVFIVAESLDAEWLGKPRDRVGHHLDLATYMLATGAVEEARWQIRAAVIERWSGNPRTPTERACITNPESPRDLRPEELGCVIEQEMVMVGRESAHVADSALAGGRSRWRKVERSGAGGAPEPPPAPASPVATVAGPPAPASPAIGELQRVLDYWAVMLVPSRLGDGRRAFLNYGGASNIDTDVKFVDVRSVVRYVPRALMNAAFTPNPFTRFAAVGPSGPLRTLSIVEVGLFMVLLGLVIYGLPTALARARGLTLGILVYSLILAVIIGVLVPNVGILFRLRLSFVIPLCVLAGAPWSRARTGRP